MASSSKTDLNIITDHIDIWTSAIKQKSSSGRGSSKKISLYGIKKLRELILELAVRGKLVPQDASDEPASILLERIAAEKAQLVKDKKIKKPKFLPEISDDEKPFGLPSSWSACRLAELLPQFQNGASSRGDSNGREVVVLRLADIKNWEVSLHYTRSIKIEEKSITRYQLDKGDVLIIRVNGSADIVGRFITCREDIDAIYCDHFIRMRLPIEIFIPEFISLLGSSNLVRKKISELFVSTAGQKTVNQTHINSLVVTVPPLEEQHRIVVKVDELMSLCDALEAQTEASIGAHQTLVETLLNALLLPTNSGNTANSIKPRADSLEPTLDKESSPERIESPEQTFSESWQRVAEHFDTLFTTNASIDTLKQTILQLAVMGKLVPQASFDERNRPNYEPAAKLLERIAVEKAQLIADKKIKKQKPLAAITDEEKPFELPQSWAWSQLQEITSKITDGDHKTPPRIDSGYRLLSAKNVRDGYVDYDNTDYIAEFDYLKSRGRCHPETGDLMIVSVGGTIGRNSLVPNDSDFALVRSVALIKPLIFSSEYLKYSMDSKLLQGSIHENKRGGAQPCLYLSEINKFILPMPPLEEQHRIVAKVDELMVLCDQLKARLTDAQTTQLHLTDAIVEQAL